MVSSLSPVVIVGSGAIGACVGGLLQAAGREVIFIARGARRAELATHGLHLTDYTGLDLRLPADTLRLDGAETALPRAGTVLVCVKSAATAEVARTIVRFAPASAPVVSLQNGLNNVAQLREALPGRVVVPGMVPFNVVKGAEGRLHRGTSGDLTIGAGVEGLAALLAVPGLGTQESAQIEAIQRGKLLLNLNNALNALSGLPLRDELSDPRWRALLAAQISEALAVYRAEGWDSGGLPLPAPLLPLLLRLPNLMFTRIAKRMLAIDPQARSSMQEDLAAGQRTEIDEFQGLIIDLARKHGLKASACQSVMEAVRKAEQAGAGSPRLTPEQI